jgi:hypothetical protein
LSLFSLFVVQGTADNGAGIKIEACLDKELVVRARLDPRDDSFITRLKCGNV